MNVKQLFWAFRFPILVFVVSEIALDPIIVRLPWFDKVMHVLGGIVVALSAVELLAIWHEEKKFSGSAVVRFLFIVSFVALIAVAWEWYEVLRAALSNTLPNSLEDTLADLAFGIGGAMTIGFWRRVR